MEFINNYDNVLILICHMYNYLIIGSGLFGATFTCEATKHGKRCLIIEKRSQLGGNVYCEQMDGINVHKYGAYISLV